MCLQRMKCFQFLVLSGRNFTNLKQYSLSKWFQLYQMTVNRSSLQDGAFLWTIIKTFTINFQSDFKRNIRWPCHWFYTFFWKKSFNPLGSLTRYIIILINYFIITKLIFNWWNEKVIQDIDEHRCIDCWGKECHLPWSCKYLKNVLRFICYELFTAKNPP